MWDLDPSIAPHSAISQVSHPDPVTSFAFSPCGKKLASLLVTRNAIYVWDTPNFTIDLSTTIDFHYLNLLAYSPDGRYILCVRHQGTNLQIWDAETGKPSTVYPLAPAMYHNPPIQKIFFVPSDNRWLLVVHVGGTRLKIWDDDGSKPEIQVELPLNFDNRFPHDGRGVTPFHGVQAFSPDISRAFVVIPDPSASSSVRLEVWFTDTMERPPIQLHDAPKEIDLVEFQGSFSPCGRLVEVHNVRGGIYIWDAETGALVSRPIRVLHTPGAPRTWVTVVFSPDSNFIASAPFWSSTMDKAIHIWNVRTGDRVRGPWDVHKDAVTHLAFSPDGSTLVSSSKDGTIGFWDASDLHERVQGSKPTGGLPDAFSIEDGWAMGESGELLFWIPPELRTGMWRPKNTKVISPGPTAKLDYTRFKYGRDWAECRNGQQSD
jgi:WD40 repeat protein